MRIKLWYENGEEKEIDTHYGYKNKEGQRPIRARVSADVKRNSFVWQKIRMGMKPGYEWDIGYI